MNFNIVTVEASHQDIGCLISEWKREAPESLGTNSESAASFASFACIAINSESNESVGFALAGEQQGKNVIDLVYVAKGNKGNQIGKSLIQYVEQNYAQQNTFLYVTVCSSQNGRHEKLVSYYHKLGYKRNKATEEFVELAKQI